MKKTLLDLSKQVSESTANFYETISKVAGSIQCPYCNETLYFEPEPTDEVLEYVEDCHVCCQLILIKIQYSESGSRATARKENG